MSVSVLANGMHKNERRGAYGRLWNLNQKKVEELLYLLVFVWSRRSEG